MSIKLNELAKKKKKKINEMKTFNFMCTGSNIDHPNV